MVGNVRQGRARVEGQADEIGCACREAGRPNDFPGASLPKAHDRKFAAVAPIFVSNIGYGGVGLEGQGGVELTARGYCSSSREARHAHNRPGLRMGKIKRGGARGGGGRGQKKYHSNAFEHFTLDDAGLFCGGGDSARATRHPDDINTHRRRRGCWGPGRGWAGFGTASKDSGHAHGSKVDGDQLMANGGR